MYKHGGDIYHNYIKYDFSANTNLMGIPERVVQAAIKGVRESAQYPDPECTELREKIAGVIGHSSEYIICGNGAADIIFSLVLALRPKKALIPVPTFHEYEQALKTVNCQIEYFIMEEKDGFCLQEEFLEAITEDVDIIFLCNPNNPTGHLLGKDFLEQVLERCECHHVILVMDECFIDFVENKKQYSLIDQIEQSNQLFILKAFTKLYAMAGLRLGYGVSKNTNLIHAMKEVMQPWSVSTPAQKAGIAALEEEEYVKASLQKIGEEKQYLKEELHQLSCKVYGSQANYIFFRWYKGLYASCLKNGVMIRDCSNYHGLTEGFYRIAVRNHQENEYLINLLKEELKWRNQS